MGEYVTLDRMVYCLFRQEAAAVHLLSYFVLIAFLEEAFIRNIIITVCINYDMH